MIVHGHRGGAGVAGDAAEGRAGRLQLCPRELHLAQDLRADLGHEAAGKRMKFNVAVRNYSQKKLELG